jgi:hypothetical protein
LEISIFSPITVLFLPYSHIKELLCSWNLTYTRFFLKIIGMFILWKIRRTCNCGKRNIKIPASSSEVSLIFPHFVLKSTEREVMLLCSYQLWWALI